MTVIGVVSPGSMGAGLGHALVRGGARVVTTVAGRSARTASLAAVLDLRPDLAAVVAEAGVSLVVTPPAEAAAAARAIAAAAERTGASPLLVDMNAISPTKLAAIAAAIAPLPFVDGAISGPPPTLRPGATLYFSGPRAAEVAALPWTDVRPVVVGPTLGSASAVKMCTASVQKGLWGLVAHALVTASAHDVLAPVAADLASFLARDDLARPVAMAATKAHRYVAEMNEIAATQGAAGLTPTLFEAFATAYAAIAGSDLGGDDPESVLGSVALDEVVRRLNAPRGSDVAGS
jgi:3-hydroxyisobutyrate dehydrogenase-like beta-hydroxyacid dehydrogenase